jgi:hypothetical protein
VYVFVFLLPHFLAKPPRLQTFYQKLGPRGSPVEEELTAWLASLEKIIAQLEGVYENGN